MLRDLVVSSKSTDLRCLPDLDLDLDVNLDVELDLDDVDRDDELLLFSHRLLWLFHDAMLREPSQVVNL